MRIIWMTLGLTSIASLLISCGNGLPVPPVMATPTVPLVMNRWDIFLFAGPECPAPEDGWKIIKMFLVLENKNSDYTAAKIKTTDAKLFTDIDHSYPVTTFKTTGAVSASTGEISFETKLPPGYRMLGEYQKDLIVSYYFQAKIPSGAKPKFVRMPGYLNDINLVEQESMKFPVKNGADSFKKANEQITLPGKSYLVVGEFTRMRSWPPVNDRITGSVTITNLEDGADNLVTLKFVPIGDNGIVGEPFVNGVDCKNEFTVGPSRPITATICAIIPHDTKNLRMIFLGDVNAVYEIKENGNGK